MRSHSGTRLQSVDGLRGVAALSVLGYHAWLYSLPRVTSSTRETTFDAVAHELRLGLVLFFVLSGFLLFGPWVRAAREGRPRPRVLPYAVRRAARILPAYWAALAGSMVLVWWGARGTPGVRLPPAEDLWLFVVLGQNFKEATLLKLDPPMWTLTVEATFYAVLPLLGAAAYALRRRGGLAARCAVPLLFLAAGVAWNWWIAGRGLPETTAKILPAMAPYFAVGMLAAVAVASLGDRPVPTRRLLAAGALLVVADAVWHWHGATQGSAALELRIVRDLPAAAGFALVLVAAARDRGPVPLSHPALVRVGVWSYGLYLWHVPVLVWLRARGLLPSDALPALAVAAPPSLALAALSWRYVEAPAIAWSRRASWASRPGMNVPVPSHHGQGTLDGEPPRFDTTSPVPLQGPQGDGAGVSGSSSAALKARRG